MSAVFTGITTVINGFNDNAVLAELVSRVTYEMLEESATDMPLSITREEYELFTARQGRSLVDAGILDEELNITGKFLTDLR